jgi:hypothetical protein
LVSDADVPLARVVHREPPSVEAWIFPPGPTATHNDAFAHETPCIAPSAPGGVTQPLLVPLRPYFVMKIPSRVTATHTSRLQHERFPV